MKSNVLLCCMSPFLMIACSSSKGKTPPIKKEQRPNILFICIDDLRTELGCYGFSEAKTPNLDGLAAEGSLFFHQYASVPTSGASRASMLSGRLPRDREDVSNDAAEFRLTYKPEGKVPETFVHQLKRNGYYTVGLGKISHAADGYVYPYTATKSDQLELPYSWNEMLFNPGKWGTGWNAFFAYANGSNRQSMNKQVKPYECGDVSDEGYPDGLTAQLAVSKLDQLAQKDQPFCLAVGFFKPHLPFNSPKKYWDLYEEDNLSTSPVPFIPKNVNKASLQKNGEFNGYKLGDENATLDQPVSDAYARKLRHAYLSCISYTDAQVGKVLTKLKALGLADNTIIVVWGDHGWHLGDMNVWGKHTIMETAVNSTFIMRVPGKKAGIKNKRIVSAVDIYPTLMELCNIKTPYPLDGKSFVSLLNQPNDPTWEDRAYSYFNSGISLRTKEYRYSYYYRQQQPVEELFQYTTDRFERENIASQHPAIVKQLRPLWEKGNTGLYTKE